MKKKFSKKIIFASSLLFLILLYVIFSFAKKVEHPQYGVSFNTIYAQELGLNWKEVYDAFIEELQVKKIRLAAHWTMVEPNDDQFNFTELDYQVQKAQENNVEIIFAVGKRLPRWPECHVPEWAKKLSKEEQESHKLKYIEETVRRYKDIDSIKIWQVENEPFLGIFAQEHCMNFDKNFLQEEIDLVKKIDDKNRPILVTDSGELSTWYKIFHFGDIFGTTLYVYSWNSVMGEFRNPFLPGFYSLRKNIWQFFIHDKPVIIAELALEPWLDTSVVKAKTEVQIERMSPEKFDTVIEFAKQTGIETQYLWGAEWWYYMKLQGMPVYWEKGKDLFLNGATTKK